MGVTLKSNMSAALPQNPDGNCCLPVCDDEVIAQVPGPQGEPGIDGADGEDGVSAFALTAAQFTFPAEGATVSVTTTTPTTFLTPTQIVYVQTAGWMSVVSVGTNSAVLRNEENTASALYTDNVAPTTVIAAGVKITAGGKQGPTGGTPAGTAFAIANNLSEGNAATMRTTLALNNVNNTSDANKPVSAAQAAADAAAQAAAIAASQPVDAFLTSVAALGTAADRMVYTTAPNVAAEAVLTAAGRALLDDADVAAQRATLGVLPRVGLLGSLAAVDLGVLGDTLIPIIGSTRYRVTHIVIENANASLATVMLGVFSQAGGIGTIAANQAVTGATAADKFVSLTISSIGLTDIFTGTDLYFRVGTIQAAATVSVWVFGESFS